MICPQKNLITNPREMFNLLYLFAHLGRPGIIGYIDQGRTVPLRFDSTKFWLIDDPKIYKEFLKEEERQNIILTQIRSLFNSGYEERDKIYQTISQTINDGGDLPLEYQLAPFSEAVRRRVGVCLERSIFFQLWQQEKFPSFFLAGWYKDENKTAAHAFNAVFRDNILLLIDVKKNPKRKEGEWCQGYEPTPIIAINEESGELILEPTRAEGRRYIVKDLGYKEINRNPFIKRSLIK